MVIKLEEFKDLHKNEDIYVIGAGKSLDFVDNSFFKNKITIGINQVYKKVQTNYLVRKEKKFINEVLSLFPDCYHFISKNNCGGNYDNNNEKYILNNYENNKNIILYDHNINKHKLEKLPEDNKLIVSHSTITTGIHLAAYMGAKNIILVGHDCGSLDGKNNFDGYHTKKTLFMHINKGDDAYLKWLGKI